jgi:hypothetical protein
VDYYGYVYETIKKTKQNRHRREYIGKIGQGGEFIPNKNYQKKVVLCLPEHPPAAYFSERHTF